tara:strand:- start:491 stop:772 length:282 start_codon:yes stop_codon:yes gene_type:complete
MKKLLYTFFFGYAAFKWRRLIRTLIIIPTFGSLLFVPGVFFDGIYDSEDPFYYSILKFFGLALVYIAIFIITYIIIGLISWLIKPFIVKENQP